MVAEKIFLKRLRPLIIGTYALLSRLIPGVSAAVSTFYAGMATGP